MEAFPDLASLSDSELKDLITRLANRYGSQAVIVAIDARRAGNGSVRSISTA